MRQRKKKTRPREPPDPFAKLTWEDLEEWAGNRIVDRGRSYQERGAVGDLERAGDGALVAWVLGSRPYATRVRLDAGKKLKSECTCPYWETCKHAVAVVLEYSQAIKTGIAVGRLEEDDPRVLQLEAMEEESEPGDTEFFEEELEDFEELDEHDRYERVIEARSGASGKSGTASLRTWLKEQTKAELVALVVSVAEAHEEARQWFLDRRALGSGRAHEILRTIRREIRALEEAVWDEYQGVPAGGAVRLHVAIEALVKAGHAEEAARLGPELLAAGTRALEHEQEGESAHGLTSCFDVLFRALDRTSLSPADQVEWALDMAQADGYGLCDDGLDRVWKKRYGKSGWSAVADRLAERVEATEFVAGDRFSRDFRRDRTADWLIRALEKAGRQDEIIPLCEREASVTLNYERLVDRLMAGGRREEARRWCRQGIEAVPSEDPDLGEGLLRQLQTITRRSGEPLAGLAIQAEQFFADPSLEGFQSLGKAARKARLGKGVEAWSRHYLETGRRPGAGRQRKCDPAAAWPLPVSEVEVRTRGAMAGAPMTRILIPLAIAEKKPDEVLKWYDHPSGEKRGFGVYDYGLDIEVAEAVKSAHPDRAIGIWREMAEMHIARVQASGYEAAVPYLRKMKTVFTRSGRKQEWEEYLSALRERNRRRPRCLESLDRLERGSRRLTDG